MSKSRSRGRDWDWPPATNAASTCTVTKNQQIRHNVRQLCWRGCPVFRMQGHNLMSSTESTQHYKLYNAWKFQTSTVNKSPFLHVFGYRGQHWTLVTHGNEMQGRGVRNHCSNRWSENKYHYNFRPFVEVQLHAIYPSLSKIKLVPVAPKSLPLTPIYWNP